jgi:hypothetical protein
MLLCAVEVCDGSDAQRMSYRAVLVPLLIAYCSTLVNTAINTALYTLLSKSQALVATLAAAAQC